MAYNIDRNARCAVVGHGSWATALVKILLENERNVGWYIRNRDVLEHVRKHGTTRATCGTSVSIRGACTCRTVSTRWRAMRRSSCWQLRPFT